MHCARLADAPGFYADTTAAAVVSSVPSYTPSWDTGCSGANHIFNHMLCGLACARQPDATGLLSLVALPQLAVMLVLSIWQGVHSAYTGHTTPPPAPWASIDFDATLMPRSPDVPAGKKAPLFAMLSILFIVVAVVFAPLAAMVTMLWLSVDYFRLQARHRHPTRPAVPLATRTSQSPLTVACATTYSWRCLWRQRRPRVRV